METSTTSEPKSQILRITIQEAKECLDRGEKVYFLDVRGVPDEYQIKGSVCYEPLAILSAEHVELGIPKDSLIFTY
ncbi:MAG: hypothetical protein ACXU9P_00605 [Thermodesulfobacteriota bacterium]